MSNIQNSEVDRQVYLSALCRGWVKAKASQWLGSEASTVNRKKVFGSSFNAAAVIFLYTNGHNSKFMQYPEITPVFGDK